MDFFTSKEKGQYTIAIAILSLIILGSIGYFGNFWYRKLSGENTENEQENVIATENPAQQEPETTAEITKTEKPTVDLYVMSFCPYGNQAEDTMKPVVELLGDKVEWNVNYIVNEQNGQIKSLHGQPEVDQNIRELCVDNLYGREDFWNFMSGVNVDCGSDGDCWEEIASSLNLNASEISSCVSQQGENLIAEEVSKTESSGVTGSPTLFVNGVKDRSVIYKYGNSEAYKNLICSAFETTPEECSTVLENSGSQASGSCN